LLHEKDERIAFLTGEFEGAKRGKDVSDKRAHELRRELDRVTYELDLAKSSNQTEAISADV
jgi:hypothetical protein